MRKPDPRAVEMVANFVEMVHAWSRQQLAEYLAARRELAAMGVDVNLPATIEEATSEAGN